MKLLLHVCLIAPMLLSGWVLPVARAQALEPRAPSPELRNYAGTWTMDPTRSESAHQAEPSGPVTLIIKQDASLLSIETQHRDTSRLIVYRIDGSDNSNAVGNGTAKARLRWDSAKLVTETIYEINGYPLTETKVHSVSGDGHEMVVQSTVRVEHGYQWRDPLSSPPHYATGKNVFVRHVPAP